MRFIKEITTCVALATAAGASAQDPWLHIYNSDTLKVQETDIYGKVSEHHYGIFTSMPMNTVDSIKFSEKSSGEFQRMRVYYRNEDQAKSKIFTLRSLRKWCIAPNVATFHINTTADPTLKEVESKTEYLDARLTIDGSSAADDFDGEVLVRGRGNSTWNMPKKAYRLKLPVKTKLCGYRKAKNYVLLANYIDLSMMRNEVACLATQLAGMPYPTHATPVDVYFNSIYKGSYMLTEKVGVNNGSVNLTAEEEANTCMFELDVSYDETLKAKSPIFKLPVMHKDPNAPENPTEAKEWFSGWLDDFNEMEAAVQKGTNIGDYIDYTTLAKYLLVYNLSCNQELNHPKSVYLYKTRGGKYQFGPCWDFDWAFGYQPTYRHSSGNDVSKEEGEKMIAGARAAAEAIFGTGGSFGSFSYNGLSLLWLGGDSFLIYSNGTYLEWPYGVKSYVPSYQNYLLGTGSNNSSVINGDREMGNGGEFFMSIIMDNPEFMAEYKRVWDDFSSKLDILRDAFDAYAKALEPSAERNHTVWEYNYTTPVDSEYYDMADGTYAGAIRILRSWVEKRIEFIGDPANNYGLYDPQTTYKRGTVSASYY